MRTVHADISMAEAGQIMLRHGVDSLVVSRGDTVIGFVSRRDIDQSLHHKIGHAKVSDFVREPITVDPAVKLCGYKNLATAIRRLDPHTIWLAEEIGRVCAEIGMVSYAVGGFVRDLLLKRPTFDLDFVIEGSAILLAEQLVLLHPDKFKLLATHERFQTATLICHIDPDDKTSAGHRDVDLSTARIEIYEKPAALPVVQPSTIESDLFRRDFTINALAVCLNPDRFGDLVDLFNGLFDLEAKMIRILHPFSFIEDPTRIVRAARFAGRLGFELEPKTKKQAERALAMGIFDDLGGVRLKEEFRAMLTAPTRLRCLHILAELSPRFVYIDSQLIFCAATAGAIRRAERLMARYPFEEAWIIYLGALLSELPIERLSGVLERLQLTNRSKEIIESGLDLHRQMPFDLSDMKRSEIYCLMQGRLRESLAIAASIAVVGSDLRRAVKTYLEELIDTKLVISGVDLIALGYKPGPLLGEALRHTLAVKLDLKTVSRQEELDCAVDYLNR